MAEEHFLIYYALEASKNYESADIESNLQPIQEIRPLLIKSTTRITTANNKITTVTTALPAN